MLVMPMSGFEPIEGPDSLPITAGGRPINEEALMEIVVETLVPQASRAEADQFDASIDAAMMEMGGPPAGLMVHYARLEESRAVERWSDLQPDPR
jgi:hypothetical protein